MTRRELQLALALLLKDRGCSYQLIPKGHTPTRTAEIIVRASERRTFRQVAADLADAILGDAPAPLVVQVSLDVRDRGDHLLVTWTGCA